MSRIFKLDRTLAYVSGLLLILILAAVTIPGTREQPRAATAVDVSIQQFARYIDEWSEPEGYFDSDNFISNETSYLHVTDQLQKQVKPGGVYLGVGPDQNFSYIAQTRPTLAVITDIRRQNMLQHLWYKALFAMASNRLEYLSLLVSREKPTVRSDVPLEQLFRAINESRTSDKLFETNLASVKTLLLDKYKLKLSSADWSKIEYVYRTFWEEGLGLRFSSIGRNNAFNYPTLEELLLETDRSGRQQSYLASEDRFQQLKKFETENRLIPIVGDFAGPTAFKNVATFLKSNGLQVSTFYTSNVEFYLFNSPAWQKFVRNLRLLPFTDDAIFVRSYFGNGRVHPLNMSGHRSTSLTKAVAPFFTDYDAQRIREYWDIVKP